MQPKYQQFANDLRKVIESGKIAVGSAFPSAAELRNKYGVRQLTVHPSHLELLIGVTAMCEKAFGCRISGDKKSLLFLHPHWNEVPGGTL